MNRPKSVRAQSTRRRKIALAIAGLFAIGSISQHVVACDYCDMGDGGIVCDSYDSCDDCAGIGIGTPNGPIFKTLDAFAGGLEKMLGLDNCAPCDSGCDLACDAAIIDDTMWPMAPATTEQYTQPVMPSVPPETYTQPQPYTQPLQPEGEHGQPQTPAPMSEPEAENGGLFETLDNPFMDDEVRRAPRRSVQPSSYLPRPVRSQPSRTVSRYLNNPSAKSHAQTHQQMSRNPHTTAQRPSGGSLKRAAGRVTKPPVTSTRVTHRRPSQQHYSPHQVRLSQAPTPKRQTASYSQGAKRYSASVSKPHAPTAQRPTLRSYYAQ
jgi:hypothetical protein